jgi:hypothetical protein
MTPEDRDDRLHDALEAQVCAQPGSTVNLLTRRVRRTTRDATVSELEVERHVDRSPVLVGLPDGTVTHLRQVLEGSVLTQRVRSATAGRTDLWTTLALAPLTMLALGEPLPLASGGLLRAGAFGHSALVGPAGWLPEVQPWELVGLELCGGEVHPRVVRESELGDLARHQRVREAIALHYRRERWLSGTEHLETRPAEVVNAIAFALLEDPKLLAEPLPPLDELLHDALEEQHQHHWRDFEACRQDLTVSFTLTGMPEALHMELNGRARRYGMSFDQYVIAVLGHLAWRTPFAEDMEPWKGWSPDDADLAPTRSPGQAVR